MSVQSPVMYCDVGDAAFGPRSPKPRRDVVSLLSVDSPPRRSPGCDAPAARASAARCRPRWAAAASSASARSPCRAICSSRCSSIEQRLRAEVADRALEEMRGRARAARQSWRADARRAAMPTTRGQSATNGIDHPFQQVEIAVDPRAAATRGRRSSALGSSSAASAAPAASASMTCSRDRAEWIGFEM